MLLLLLPLSSLLHQTLGQESGPVVSDINEDTQKEILDQINGYRRNVKPTASNMLKLTWSEEARETAKVWAAKCILQTSPPQIRTINGSVICGETLSQGKVPMKWSNVIDLWHKSSAYFEYGVGATDPKKSFLPYSQLIWYRAHKIGCAGAYCPDSSFPFMFVCHFCPGGNIAEEINTPYKKGEPCGDCPDNCEEKLCTNPCLYADKTPNCDEIMATFTCKTRLRKQCEATCYCKTEIK